MLSRRFLRGSLTVAITCAALAGCGPKGLRAIDLEVKLDPELRATVAVDLVGVSDADKAAWEQMKVSEYWAPGDPQRQAAIVMGIVYHMEFSAGGQGSKTLSKQDPIWGKWSKRGAYWLFVLADLPGAHDKPGAAEVRRKIVPLGDVWPKDTKIVTITLYKGAVDVQPPPMPEGG